MFGSLGFPELLLIFVVALIVFGPRKLPEIGRTLGKALGEFKKATEELKNTIEKEVSMEEHRRNAPPEVPTPVHSVSRGGPVALVAVESSHAETHDAFHGDPHEELPATVRPE